MREKIEERRRKSEYNCKDCCVGKVSQVSCIATRLIILKEDEEKRRNMYRNNQILDNNI